VIVLTDGASNAGTPTPYTAANFAAAYGVRVYTIGIGAAGPVPYPTEFGRIAVSLDLDERVLQDVSRMTGGKYFRAADAASLEAAFSELNRLEPTEYVVPGGIRRISLSPAFASLAAIIVLLEQLLAASYLRSLASW
jgi:Ca-activated chloride channel family protein